MTLNPCFHLTNVGNAIYAILSITKSCRQDCSGSHFNCSNVEHSSSNPQVYCSKTEGYCSNAQHNCSEINDCCSNPQVYCSGANNYCSNRSFSCSNFKNWSSNTQRGSSKWHVSLSISLFFNQKTRLSWQTTNLGW